MAFSDRVTEESKGIDAAVKANVQSAFNTFQTAMASEFATYGTPAQEKQEFEDRLIDLMRFLSAAMR